MSELYEKTNGPAVAAAAAVELQAQLKEESGLSNSSLFVLSIAGEGDKGGPSLSRVVTSQASSSSSLSSLSLSSPSVARVI